MLFTVVGAMVSGGVITFQGHYWWWLVVGPLIGTVGAGLLFTIDANTPYVGLPLVFPFYFVGARFFFFGTKVDANDSLFFLL